MHKSALDSFKNFTNTYLKFIENPHIVEIGSLIKNKKNKLTSDALRLLVDKNIKFTGVDIEDGSNVDLVLKDPYKIPLPDNSIDMVVSVSTFEHTEFFWLTYLEILRILKPKGIFYFNVPSNGDFHRWPQDCWRFYPDSGNALINWAKRNNFNPILLESYVSNQFLECGWNDYVSVTLKDQKYLENFNDRIIYKNKKFLNGIDHNKKLYNYSNKSEDHKNWGFRLWYRIRKKIDKIKK